MTTLWSLHTALGVEEMRLADCVVLPETRSAHRIPVAALSAVPSSGLKNSS